MPRQRKLVRNALEREQDLKLAQARKRRIEKSSATTRTNNEFLEQNILGKKNRWTPGTRVIVIKKPVQNNETQVQKKTKNTSSRNTYLMCSSPIQSNTTTKQGA